MVATSVSCCWICCCCRNLAEGPVSKEVHSLLTKVLMLSLASWASFNSFWETSLAAAVACSSSFLTSVARSPADGGGGSGGAVDGLVGATSDVYSS